MIIHNASIEDYGIGLGIVHEDGFIPLSYNTGRLLQDYLKLMINDKHKILSFLSDEIGELQFSREEAIKIYKKLLEIDR